MDKLVEEIRAEGGVAEAIARSIQFTISQPDDVDTTEMVVRPAAASY